jgi:uncharacterized membrane protein YedE/YeeE
MIGLAASFVLIATGRVTGISGMLSGLLLPVRGDVAWRAFFMVGLLVAGAVAYAIEPDQIGGSPRSLGLIALAGLLVGAGTRIGNGCTSGHGVCGISRLSPRSLIATVTFIASGVVVVMVTRLLGGDS